MCEGRRDPFEDRRRLLARREDVGRGDDAMLAREGQDPRRLLAAHELRRAQVQVVGRRDRVPRRVGGRVRGVRADHVQGRPRPIGTDRQHAGRGLHPVSAPEQRRVNSVAGEQLEHHVAELVGADRAGAPDARPELGQRHGRTARGPRRGDANLLDERPALPGRDLLDGTDEYIDDVYAERDDVHGSLRRVIPYPRRVTASTKSSCWAAPSVRGSPTAAARQYSSHAHSSSSVCCTATSRSGP